MRSIRKSLRKTRRKTRRRTQRQTRRRSRRQTQRRSRRQTRRRTQRQTRRRTRRQNQRQTQRRTRRQNRRQTQRNKRFFQRGGEMNSQYGITSIKVGETSMIEKGDFKLELQFDRDEYMSKFKFFLALNFSLPASSLFLTLAIQYRCYRT